MSKITTDISKDRRIRRTRQALRDALIALIQEKPYESISVLDITERANVNRSTFYLHYRDKEELLFKSFVDIYAELFVQSQRVVREDVLNGDWSAITNPVDFKHVGDNAGFYKVVLNDKGVAPFVAQTRRYLASLFTEAILVPLAKGITPRFPLEFLGYCMAGLEIGAVCWWLETGMKQTPEEMAQMMKEIWASGVFSSLQVPRPEEED